MANMEPEKAVIPVIDIQEVGLQTDDHDINDDNIDKIGRQLINAMSSVGFCYLTNHGIDESLIKHYMAVSRDFLRLPIDEKQKYETRKDGHYFGYIGAGLAGEQLNPKRPGDLKESFNFFPPQDPDNWPTNMREFHQANQSMFKQFKSLALRMCDALSISLGLDKDYMRNAHRLIGKDGNKTALRSLLYPPMTSETVVETGQIRLSEHTDYGTITLLIQDDIGGLEVNAAGKGYVPATPIPGTVVVNIGDMMQRWTSDLLISTEHRVDIPQDEIKRRQARQSVVFFVIPDDEYVITSLDGSDKYKPVTMAEYFDKNYRATVQY